MSMITKEQIMSGSSKTTLKTLVNGGVGTGKTFYALTHPKCVYLCTEPNGLDTARANPALLENLVWAEEFIPSPVEDVKAVFERLESAIQRAFEGAGKGEVETLILDNISFLSENRWMYIQKYERLVSANGSLDTRGMYGTLSRWLYQFTLTKLLSFPGNVVVTCHEQIEGDEAMSRKVDKSTPVVPNILGGFREKVAGMFSASLYLEKKRKPEGSYTYLARCQKGAQRDAKNRYGLPEIVENISYQAIINAIPKQKAVEAIPSPAKVTA
jgi:hypothetical protein